MPTLDNGNSDKTGAPKGKLTRKRKSGASKLSLETGSSTAGKHCATQKGKTSSRKQKSIGANPSASPNREGPPDFPPPALLRNEEPADDPNFMPARQQEYPPGGDIDDADRYIY